MVSVHATTVVCARAVVPSESLSCGGVAVAASSRLVTSAKLGAPVSGATICRGGSDDAKLVPVMVGVGGSPAASVKVTVKSRGGPPGQATFRHVLTLTAVTTTQPLL